MQQINRVKVFATSGSETIADGVCEQLASRLPQEMLGEGIFSRSRSIVARFSNQNIQVQVEDVRGCFAVILHSQVPPVNENLIELIEMIDAISNANVGDILVVFPYMPYSRSDYKKQGRTSTMAVVFADIISRTLGVERVLLLDPHAPHLKHYFHPAADEISAAYLLVDYIERVFFNEFPREQCVVVFADSGAAKRYENIMNILKIDVAHIDKRRADHSERPQAHSVIGNVENKICIIFDDEILTGNTVIEDANLLRVQGAKSCAMFAVHGVFEDKNTSSENVIQRLEESLLERIVITNSIPVMHKIKDYEKFVLVNAVGLLAEGIAREILCKSLTKLHDFENVNIYRVPS